MGNQEGQPVQEREERTVEELAFTGLDMFGAAAVGQAFVASAPETVREDTEDLGISPDAQESIANPMSVRELYRETHDVYSTLFSEMFEGRPPSQISNEEREEHFNRCHQALMERHQPRLGPSWTLEQRDKFARRTLERYRNQFGERLIINVQEEARRLATAEREGQTKDNRRLVESLALLRIMSPNETDPLRRVVEGQDDEVQRILMESALQAGYSAHSVFGVGNDLWEARGREREAIGEEISPEELSPEMQQLYDMVSTIMRDRLRRLRELLEGQSTERESEETTTHIEREQAALSNLVGEGNARTAVDTLRRQGEEGERVIAETLAEQLALSMQLHSHRLGNVAIGRKAPRVVEEE